MLRSSNLWSAALRSTNNFVFELRLGSWDLPLLNLTPKLPTDRQACSLGPSLVRAGKVRFSSRPRAGCRTIIFYGYAKRSPGEQS
jgi:hypothetical protein